MSRSTSGAPRYVKHRAERLTPMDVGGVDLGVPLKPQDLLIWLRQIEHLEDREIVDAFALALTRVDDLLRIFPEMIGPEIDQAVEAATEVTGSRVKAWRTRNREMTWLEMRMMLVGLRELMDGRDADAS